MSRGPYLQQARRLMLVTSAAALTAACSSDPPVRTVGGVSRSVFSEDEYGVRTSPRVASVNVPKGGGGYKLGSPYKVAGRWYVPREDPNYEAYGVASWYGADFHGRRTANGEVFDANALTAAHPTMPLPCYAYVTNLDNGRTVLVRVNDRGPYVNDRIIDMSYAAAKAARIYISRARPRPRPLCRPGAAQWRRPLRTSVPGVSAMAAKHRCRSGVVAARDRTRCVRKRTIARRCFGSVVADRLPRATRGKNHATAVIFE